MLTLLPSRMQMVLKMIRRTQLDEQYWLCTVGGRDLLLPNQYADSTRYSCGGAKSISLGNTCQSTISLRVGGVSILKADFVKLSSTLTPIHSLESVM